MSYREVDPNIVSLIKSLQADIEFLKNQIGKTRQNSIRLGNWVLEAESDEKVKMTNVKTGVVTYVGWATCDELE